jgi:hypothetical protein
VYRGSQRLPEAPRGSQRLGAHTHTHTHVCLLPNSVFTAALCAMASCSESLYRGPSIPRRDPRKSPQASPVAGRWARNLDSVVFRTEAPRSSQRLPEAPRGPSQAGGSHTHLHTNLHLNQKSGKKLPGPAQTFFSCTIMANLPTCIISRDPSWILRMHRFRHFRLFFCFLGPAVLCQNSVPKFVEVEISVCMCSPWVLPHTTVACCCDVQYFL